MKTLIDGPRGGKLSRQKRTPEECLSDFWKRVDVKSKDECWPWTAGVHDKSRSVPYGIAWFNGKKHKAHRFALETTGVVLGKLLACHTCDNPICCNPAHLYAGTHNDNVQDCIQRGRKRSEKGEDRYNARLTEEQIREIRARYTWRKYGTPQIAKDYGISKSMAFAIITKARWAHVE